MIFLNDNLRSSDLTVTSNDTESNTHCTEIINLNSILNFKPVKGKDGCRMS